MTRLFCHSVAASFAADLDDDGRIDLVVANHRAAGSHQAESAIWWNGPDGFNPSRCTALPTLGPHGMCSVPPRNLITGGGIPRVTRVDVEFG